MAILHAGRFDRPLNPPATQYPSSPCSRNRRPPTGRTRRTEHKVDKVCVLALPDAADGTVSCGRFLGCRIHNCCRVVVSNGRQRYLTTSGFGIGGRTLVKESRAAEHDASAPA